MLISFIEEGDEEGEFITELVQEGTDACGDVYNKQTVNHQTHSGTHRDRGNTLSSRGCYSRNYMYDLHSYICDKLHSMIILPGHSNIRSFATRDMVVVLRSHMVIVGKAVVAKTTEVG